MNLTLKSPVLTVEPFARALPKVVPAAKTSKFVIEKVKWKWAPEVRNPQVYRDDEFVRTKTKEEALEAIEFLMGQPRGLTYTITVERDGEFFTYFRSPMPCLGGLVKYRDSHGSKYFMNPYFPRDIYVAFPEGSITFIACHRPQSKNLPKSSPYWEFVFSQESPWVAAFGRADSVIFADNYFVLTNMEGDPTIFYSLMRLGGLMNGYGAAGNLKDWHPKAQILWSKASQADPRRMAGQKPIITSGGPWSSGFCYTRPWNESIFKTSLPLKLKDFGTLPTTGYPPGVPFAPAYFVSTMKEKFGVDVSKPAVYGATPPDQKIHDALLKSWDYFREEAGKLKD